MKMDYNKVLWVLILFFVIGIKVRWGKAEMVNIKTTIIWEKSIEGKEVGYPLVVDNQAYMTFYSNNQIQVLGINLINGEKIWQTEYNIDKCCVMHMGYQNKK